MNGTELLLKLNTLICVMLQDPAAGVHVLKWLVAPTLGELASKG